MATQEGFRPLYVDGVCFAYCISQMKYYLKMNIETWFAIKEGFKIPTTSDRELLEFGRFSNELKKKT